MRTSLVSAVLFAFLFTALSSPSGWAAPAKAPDLAGTMEAHKIILNKENREVAVSAEKVFPRDKIEYTLTYRNVGAADASGISLVGPIPPGTVYLDKTASNGAVVHPLYSIDGGKSYHRAPFTYVYVDASGKDQRKAATPDMYTHIKWDIDGSLGAGKDVVVSYRVQVK